MRVCETLVMSRIFQELIAYECSYHEGAGGASEFRGRRRVWHASRAAFGLGTRPWAAGERSLAVAGPGGIGGGGVRARIRGTGVLSSRERLLQQLHDRGMRALIADFHDAGVGL